MSRGAVCTLFTPEKLKMRVCFKSQTVSTEGPPACVWLQGVKHPKRCCNSAGTGTSVPPRAWEWLCFYPNQTDTCCVNWQVGSWCSSSVNLLVPQPRGQIHFTPFIIPDCMRQCFLQSLNVTQTANRLLSRTRRCFRVQLSENNLHICKIRLIRMETVVASVYVVQCQ